MMRSTQNQKGFVQSLFARLLLVMATLIALALGAAIWITFAEGKRAAEVQVAEDLDAITTAQRRIEEQNDYRLSLQTDFIAADKAVAEYLNVTTGDDLGFSDEQTDTNQASVADLLRERQESLGFSIGIITDSSGNVVARTDESERFEQSMTQDPFLGPMITDVEPRVGYWRQGDKLFQVAGSPIGLDDTLVGFLMLGAELDSRQATQIAELSGAQVAYFLKQQGTVKLLATSLSSEKTADLSAAFEANSKATMAVFDEKPVEKLLFNVGGDEYAARLTPVSGFSDGAVLALSPTARTTAPFQQIQNSVLVVGLISLALTLLAAFFLSRLLLKPLGKLTEATENAAAGNFQNDTKLGGSKEIGRLSEAVDKLLSSLREKSDIEGYFSNLSKLLPEPGAESGLTPTNAVRSAPPQRYSYTLVALEMRRFHSNVASGEEMMRFTQLATTINEVRAYTRVAEGTILAQSGASFLLGFGGEENVQRALATLNAILNKASALHGPSSAAALVHGDVLYGTLPTLEPERAALGITTLQAQRLLVEAGTGQILLTPKLGKELAARLGHELHVVNGGASGKRFYALTQTDLNGFVLPNAQTESDGAATRVAGDPFVDAPRRGGESGGTRMMPGMRFGGRFEVLAVLGVGGMGVVYKARDLELDDVVALKMLRPGMLGDDEQLDRFKTELKLARKITHASVLRTFDFGEINGQPFLSMEYVRGMTLRYLLQQSGRLPYSAGLRIARQITAGLRAAHDMGVIHRDLKPENVIIESNGNAKLMDFGIARPVDRKELGHTQPGMFIGTPGYAAPEALQGGDVDVRADLYAMGVMFCEMFCGALPFQAANTIEMYLAHVQLPPISPSTLWPDVPKDLEKLILTCLEKDRTNRFVNADALLEALCELRA